ncbi:hypothetical protein AHAS_Ahas19G0290300 [Arachis hypogaea]
MRVQKLDTMSEHPTIVLKIFKRIQQCFKLHYLLQGHVHTVMHVCFTMKHLTLNAPQELLEIFLDPSAEGNHFRKHIRGYNSTGFN